MRMASAVCRSQDMTSPEAVTQKQVDDLEVTSLLYPLLEVAGVLRRKVTSTVTAPFAMAMAATRSTKDAGLNGLASAREAAAFVSSGVRELGPGTFLVQTTRRYFSMPDSKVTAPRDQAVELAADVKARLQESVLAAWHSVAEKTVAGVKVGEFLQITAGAAAKGAMYHGANGGDLGLAIGGTVGALCGLPLAFFTFGMSIPAGAIICGGTGLFWGATAGAAGGAMWGGIAGCASEKQKTLRSSVRGAASSVRGGASHVKTLLYGRLQGTGMVVKHAD